MSEYTLSSMEDKIEIAAANIKHAPELKGTLKTKHFGEIVGAMGVGKTTIINLIDVYGDEFSQAGSFTTRTPRADDKLTGKYRYLPHDFENLSEILYEIEEGKLVQAAVHKFTRKIYGSSIEDYTNKYNLLDTVFNVIEANKKLPFASITEMSMITDPVTWQKWFTNRLRSDNISREEKILRLTDSQESVEWSLNQVAPNWAINMPGKPSETADKIIRLVRGSGEADPNGEKLALKLLSRIKTLKENYEAAA